MTKQEIRDIERACLDALYEGALKRKHRNIAYGIRQGIKRTHPWWFVERARLAALAGDKDWRLTRALQRYARMMAREEL